MQCTSLRMSYNVIRKTKTQRYCKTPKHHTKCKAQCRNMGRTNQSRIDYANVQQKRPKEGRHILRSAYKPEGGRDVRWGCFQSKVLSLFKPDLEKCVLVTESNVCRGLASPVGLDQQMQAETSRMYFGFRNVTTSRHPPEATGA